MTRKGWYEALANALQKEYKGEPPGQYTTTFVSLQDDNRHFHFNAPHHTSVVARARHTQSRLPSHVPSDDPRPKHAARPHAFPARLHHRIHTPNPPTHPLHDRRPIVQGHTPRRQRHHRSRVLDAEHPRAVPGPRTGVGRARGGLFGGVPVAEGGRV